MLVFSPAAQKNETWKMENFHKIRPEGLAQKQPQVKGTLGVWNAHAFHLGDEICPPRNNVLTHLQSRITDGKLLMYWMANLLTAHAKHSNWAASCVHRDVYLVLDRNVQTRVQNSPGVWTNLRLSLRVLSSPYFVFNWSPLKIKLEKTSPAKLDVLLHYTEILISIEI